MKPVFAWRLLFALLLSLVPIHPIQAAEEGVNVRILTLKGLYADHPSRDELNPVSLFLGNFQKPSSFPDLCRTVRSWALDVDVDHVVVDLSDGSLMLNLAQASELSRLLQSVHASGKTTFAWIGNASPISYLVASACDHVLMTDLSALDFSSLSLTVLHFHDLLQLVGAEASVVRAGDFKGAVEPFTRSEMSQELRDHYREMLRTMNDALVLQIAHGRKLTVEQVREAQAARLFTAKQAKASGLVDDVIASGQERHTVARVLDQPIHWLETARPKKASSLSLFDLVGKVLAPPVRPTARKPSLAVLHLDGQIMDTGAVFPGALTPQIVAEAVEAIEADPAIRGVVIRINSPGGSASASEAIRLSLDKLAKAKPVNFSFGDVAASGGYWVSCIGRPIYAEASTLTGSIGVFALKLSAAGLMDTVGLKLDTVSLDDSAEAFSVARPWTADEEVRVQGFVDDVYTRFVGLVAGSRALPREEVEPLAGGRVWSGSQAAEHKLIDELGGLDDALRALAEQTGLDTPPVLHWPERKSLLEKLELFGAVEGTPAAPWANLISAKLGFRVPWALLGASLSTGAPRAWSILPTQFQIH